MATERQEKNMGDNREILKRVGWGCIIVGVIESGFFFINARLGNWFLPSSMSLFAVIGGVTILHGGSRPIRIVMEFVALFVGYIGIGFVAGLIREPLMLQWLLFRTHPAENVIRVAGIVGELAFLGWVHNHLTRDLATKGERKTALIGQRPWFGFVVGALLVLGPWIGNSILQQSDNLTAKAKAQQEYGQQFSYYVNALSSFNGHVVAKVTAYNRSGMREITIRWNK